MTKDNWIKAYSKIMLEWIESQWKIESAHQAGEPYTRMKFEAEASKVEDKLKNLISQVEKDAIEKTNKRCRKERTTEIFQWLEDQGEISKYDHERLLQQILD